MYCTKGCVCSLCRELCGYKPPKPARGVKTGKASKRPEPHPPEVLSAFSVGVSGGRGGRSSDGGNSILERFNENFVLRRRADSSIRTFQEKSLKCSEMYQQHRQQQMSTPSPTPINESRNTDFHTTTIDKNRLSMQDMTININTIGRRRITNPLRWINNDVNGDGGDGRVGTIHNKPNHKVVIYFGDSIAHRSSRHNAVELNDPIDNLNQQSRLPSGATKTACNENNRDNSHVDITNNDDDQLPPYIESIESGVINIKIESNYQRANALVETVSKPTVATVFNSRRNHHWLSMISNEWHKKEKENVAFSYNQYDSCDWSYVQEWRKFSRLIANPQPQALSVDPGPAIRAGSRSISAVGNGVDAGVNAGINLPSNFNGSRQNSTNTHIKSSNFVSPVPRLPKEHQQLINFSNSSSSVPLHNNFRSRSRVPSGSIATPFANYDVYTADITHANVGQSKIALSYKADFDSRSKQFKQQPNLPEKPPSHRPIPDSTHLTVQSTIIEAQPLMMSGTLNRSSQQQQHQQKAGADQKELAINSSTCSKNVGISLESRKGYNINHQKNDEAFNFQQNNNTSIKPVFDTRAHNHDFRGLPRVQEYQSSSDENRSSGHASMSDTGGHGSSSPGISGVALGPLPEDRLAAGVTNRSTRSRASIGGHVRVRHHRGTPAAAKSPWISGSGLEDIKQVVQQLTMRSQTSTSTCSSLSAGSESSEPAPRLGRYSSSETVSTNVTNADEFIWVDSHNRLVELQNPPWAQNCIMQVLRNGRCKEEIDRISIETVPRLGYLLQRALVRIGREVQRFSSNLGLCSKQEVAGAFKVVLCPALADSCNKACLRAAAMFAVPGDSAMKQSKSARAGLQLPVGRFHNWMVHARLGKFVHEYAAVYLCAGMENLLEEIVLQSLPTISATHKAGGDGDTTTSFQKLTVSTLESAIARSGDLWGLLQPLAHLNAGRIASGALTMPRWASQTSFGTNPGSLTSPSATAKSKPEPCLLTTCVGSVSELKDLAIRAQQKYQHIALSNAALSALYYFMRCSQLEHSDGGAGVNATKNSNSGQSIGNASTGCGESTVGGTRTSATTTTGSTSNSCNSDSSSSHNIQELGYERAYIVLPPLIEWIRVASGHAEFRNAVIIDKDDIMQAARLLLPGVDCPMRPIGLEEELPAKKAHFTYSTPSITGGAVTPINIAASGVSEDTSELGKRAALALAFKLMLTGRAELLAQAATLLPPTTRYDTINHAGMTALMVASIRNDEIALQALLDAGCDPNIEVPSVGNAACPSIHPHTQHWTAVTFAACRGHYLPLRILLERGGKVEGGARLSEDKATLTPLQVACGTGNTQIVSLLLAHGANPFLSTQQKDTLCFAGAAQRGAYCAISVAAAHGHRAVLRKLLSHPMSPNTREVLSLEEMLAEGELSPNTQAGNNNNHHHQRLSSVAARGSDMPGTLNKAQVKSLQEAMYHSAENSHLDITIELRALGVPWTLHCWMHALSAAHEHRLNAIIDQLLQDFLQVCPEDYSAQFVNECLPLLFNIFRYSKNEGTILLLADIFATCFGWDSIKSIDEPILQNVNSSRIDPKFVNNPELSDVTFRKNAYFFHPENVLLAMITDPDPLVRSDGYAKILKAREEATGSIRQIFSKEVEHFINFESDSYHNMIDWTKFELTEPPCLQFSTQDDLETLQYSNAIIELPAYPCHSQSTERFVHVVHESAMAVTDAQRMGHILSKLESRQKYSQLESRRNLID